jgi:hypothetical protein
MVVLSTLKNVTSDKYCPWCTADAEKNTKVCIKHRWINLDFLHQLEQTTEEESSRDMDEML